MQTTIAKDEKIELFLQNCLKKKLFSGSVYLIGERDRILACGALGYSVVNPEKVRMKKESIFDLASLTKPLCAAFLSILLLREKTFSLNDKVHKFIPEFKKSDKRNIQLIHLLTHTSGLPSWLPLYFYGNDINTHIRYLSQLKLRFHPGKRVLYGCPAYILMSEIIRRVAGERIDKLYKSLVTSPLKLKDTGFNPQRSIKRRIVASEKGNLFEKNLAKGIEGKYAGWRTEIIWGSVHDQNAYTLGGVSGNAGLFSTAEDLFVLSKEFLGEGEGLLSDSERKILFKNGTKGLNEDRSIGWQIASTRGSSAGSFLSPLSIGHTGFTGVSLWLDPKGTRSYILLTNRTHPGYRKFNMNVIRRTFHRIASRF